MPLPVALTISPRCARASPRDRSRCGYVTAVVKSGGLRVRERVGVVVGVDILWMEGRGETVVEAGRYSVDVKTLALL